MPFIVSIDAAREQFPSYEFVRALTPSAQKAAFHVQKDGCDLCLKIIAPTQALDRVQREVLAMQTIQHPNVVKLLEYEYSAKAGNSRHYLIEEFIEGEDMSAALVPGKSWSLSRLITFFGALCDGLEELNSHKIVHRDLKPSNIRVRSDGVPVIIDFGLARLLDMESLTETLAGAMIGTPRYFSPEQFRGTKRDIDHRTDLYALGVLIYEAAVGRHPSMTDKPQTIEQLSDAVCNSESFVNNTAFRALPPKLNLLVRRLLEKERARRPASAKLVGADFAQFRGRAMKRGVWHQCGHNSQKMVLELLQTDVGVGAIISPRDLGHIKAIDYAADYRDAGANVLLDPQFYVPQFRTENLGSYPTAKFRQSNLLNRSRQLLR